ncbi:MAG: PrsW family intramembrane metalloprotease [Sandaracinaceae bacterium]|nr:PrsW family intramembrane metalloprotease [Sandaracinaceae bacterium]
MYPPGQPPGWGAPTQQWGQPPQRHHEPGAPEGLPDPERGRRRVGCVLYTGGMGCGVLSLVALFFLLPVAIGHFEVVPSMLIGAVFAFPAAIVYLTVPRLLDRYDPEPLYALLLALAWGGVAACGFAAIVNSLVGALVSNAFGERIGEYASAVVSAPLMEEAGKGILLLGFFYFLRREFDGVVDGIIYATFCAIGFAAVENVIYYSGATLEGQLGGTVFMRGILTPWAHPLFTSMTGIGVGVARETSKSWVRWTAPVLGYAGAVFLHALWNGSLTVLSSVEQGGLVICMMIPLWLAFVGAFLIIVGVLVRRRGNIIRAHLVDEVALGHLSREELELVVSAFGGLVAYFRKGSEGTEFVRAVARLALSKWHSARAMKGNTKTISMDFIAPLRRKIRDLRARGASPARGMQ